jgi:GR25 family glycosyltransferase involved in LPS biosynthesis
MIGLILFYFFIVWILIKDTMPVDGYVIHLPRRHDRYNWVQQLKTAAKHKSGLNIRVFNAIQGTEEYSTETFFDFGINKKRSVMRTGEVGCFHSHLRAWELLEHGGYVFEDDVSLIRHPHEISTIPNNIPVLVHLLRIWPIGSHPVAPDTSYSDDLDTVNSPNYSMCAYYFSESARLILLHHSDKRKPVDDYVWDLSSRQELLVLAVKQPAVKRYSSYSDTE